LLAPERTFARETDKKTENQTEPKPYMKDAESVYPQPIALEYLARQISLAAIPIFDLR